jgi:hypothetical protein
MVAAAPAAWGAAVTMGPACWHRTYWSTSGGRPTSQEAQPEVLRPGMGEYGWLYNSGLSPCKEWWEVKYVWSRLWKATCIKQATEYWNLCSGLRLPELCPLSSSSILFLPLRFPLGLLTIGIRDWFRQSILQTIRVWWARLFDSSGNCSSWLIIPNHASRLAQSSYPGAEFLPRSLH